MTPEELAGNLAADVADAESYQAGLAALLPYAEALLEMREALKALSAQAKLTKPSSLMVPLIDDASDALESASRLLGESK